MHTGSRFDAPVVPVSRDDAHWSTIYLPGRPNRHVVSHVSRKEHISNNNSHDVIRRVKLITVINRHNLLSFFFFYVKIYFSADFELETVLIGLS